MNEATPPWRAFSSEPPATADPADQAPASGRAVPRWLVPLLAGLGGLGLGVAAAGLIVLVVAQVPAGLDDGLFTGSAPAVAAMDLPGADSPAPQEIVVDVGGAVLRPGLHRLPASARVGDAIEAAGGFAPRADLAASSEALNLAQPLDDGAKVLVPELGIDRPAQAAGQAQDDRIDLNRASQSELESLPGIGPVTAGKIIDARDDQRFGDVRDLRTRGLVGESVYEDIESLVRAG